MKSCRIITGGVGAGKTSAMEDLAEAEAVPQGFVSVNVETGYVLVNLSTGDEELVMADTDLFPDKIGRWSYSQRVFDEANEALCQFSSGTVYVDEVGRLEIGGGGFSPALKALAGKDVDLVIAVRDAFVDDVIEAFGLDSFPLTISDVISGEDEP